MAEWSRHPLKGRYMGGVCFGFPVVCLSCVLWFLWIVRMFRPLGYLSYILLGKRGMGKPHQPTHLLLLHES